MLHALAQPGDTILGLSLAHGGHLTHGMRINFSGKVYRATAYEVDRESMRIEMDQVRAVAKAEKPSVIIAGWSAYPRHLDFAAFREIADEVGAALWVDMAHLLPGWWRRGLRPLTAAVCGRCFHHRAQDPGGGRVRACCCLTGASSGVRSSTRQCSLASRVAR